MPARNLERFREQNGSAMHYYYLNLSGGLLVYYNTTSYLFQNLTFTARSSRHAPREIVEAWDTNYRSEEEGKPWLRPLYVQKAENTEGFPPPSEDNLSRAATLEREHGGEGTALQFKLFIDGRRVGLHSQPIFYFLRKVQGLCLLALHHKHAF